MNVPTLRRRSDAIQFISGYQMLAAVERLLDRAGCTTLLDVGCGSNSPLRLVNFAGHRIGLEIFEPSLEASRRAGIHDEYIRGDVRTAPLESRSADAVVAFEIIEHLPKDDGFAFLAALERVARKLVVVTTPNGFVPQGPVAGNPFQEHISGWNCVELTALGYDVHGIFGHRALRGEEGKITMRPRPLGLAVSKATERYAWSHPEHAFGLLAVKRIEPHATPD